ncbi:MAG: hypothetical protein VXW65_00350 [Pseudomonadota bacterium]|nr:hypothetical protein [Pseudomonadota bacterium]
MRVTTHQFSTVLHEPTAAQIIDILNLKLSTETDRQNQFFAAVCHETEGVTDPQDWTFEARNLVLAQYIATYNTDGNPNFVIGGKYSYSQYLLDTSDQPPQYLSKHEVGGVSLGMQPLTGRMIGVLELNCHNRIDWVIGVLAAMSRFEDDPVTEDTSQSGQRIMARVEWIKGLTANEFGKLLQVWGNARFELTRYFHWDIQDLGLVILPNPKEVGLPPTRFCAVDALPATVIYALGQSDVWRDLVIAQDQEWAASDFGDAFERDTASHSPSTPEADQMTMEGA